MRWHSTTSVRAPKAGMSSQVMYPVGQLALLARFASRHPTEPQPAPELRGEPLRGSIAPRGA